ncbi:hypothetical protein Y032_0031g2381 [Ancylostoma ceylanicum]|nr:hypothetical protein Y032_0031g2381 [Ancylostoma ceylanicum]
MVSPIRSSTPKDSHNLQKAVCATYYSPSGLIGVLDSWKMFVILLFDGVLYKESLAVSIIRHPVISDLSVIRTVISPVLHAVELDADITFKFPECEVLNNPVLQLDDVSFRYNADAPYLFRKLNLGTHANSRICIVGENGSGKTTLLKLLLGELNPSTGLRNVNRRIRIGYFTQHHVDQLDMDMTAIEVLAHNYPGKSQEEYRTALSHFGLTGDMALQSVYTLSGGQKSRLAFANIAMLK